MHPILQKLKERKLFQWAAAYSAGAFVVLQLMDALEAPLGLTPAVQRIILLVLLVGFPVTLVLAWYHGEQGRQRVSGAELVIIATLFFMTAVLIRLIPGDSAADVRVAQATPDAGRFGIAVLPFHPGVGSQDEDEVTLAAGLHSELISQLRKIRDLQVKSLSSVLEYEGRPTNARIIGEELGAAFIVEASIQASRDSIRINVWLSDTRDDEVIWDEDYSVPRRVDDIFATQREIALRIATEAGAQILPGERDRLEVDLPNNLEALDLYMEGMYHLRGARLGQGDVERAAEAFGSALDADSLWAPAHAALGEALHWIATSQSRGTTYLERSKASSERALAIDPTHAPAWASLGFVLAVGDRDFEAADAAYRRAAELGGADPQGHAFVLGMWGKWEEAQGEFDRAIAEDPRSSNVLFNAAIARYCSGDFESAVDLFTRARDLAPEAAGPALWLALSYVATGQTDEAAPEADRLWRTRRTDVTRAGGLALLYARLDSASLARELLDESDLASGIRPLAFNAAAALELGDRERALDYVEQLGAQRRGVDRLLCFDFTALASDERYQRALREGGLADPGG